MDEFKTTANRRQCHEAAQRDRAVEEDPKKKEWGGSDRDVKWCQSPVCLSPIRAHVLTLL
jgi:hypothetical protein